MIVSNCTIFVFVLLINRVSLQVLGFIGGYVVLQCSSSDTGHNLPDINVRWRHNDSLIVYDIIEGKYSVDFQDPVYKNRAEPVFKDYEKGNFSIRLKNLTHTDAGEYQCFITHSSELIKVQLVINGTEIKRDPAPETSLYLIKIIIPVLVIVVVIGIVAVIVAKIIKNKASCSGVSSSEGSLSCKG